MKKAIIASLAALSMLGVACKDRSDRAPEVKAEENRRLGDARPDDGNEGFFENDGLNDDAEGIGGSGRIENERDEGVDIDAKVDHDRNETDVDVEADKDDGKLQIDLK